MISPVIMKSLHEEGCSGSMVIEMHNNFSPKSDHEMVTKVNKSQTEVSQGDVLTVEQVILKFWPIQMVLLNIIPQSYGRGAVPYAFANMIFMD